MLTRASVTDLVLLVAEAAAETSLEGGNMALAIFIPVLIISLLLGGAYIYLTRWACRRAGGLAAEPRGHVARAQHCRVPAGQVPWAQSWGAGHHAATLGSLGWWREAGMGGHRRLGLSCFVQGRATRSHDSHVSPAGVGTIPASACPSCTPTPTARSR